MSGMQNVSFGTLTSKIGQVNFQDFDLDKDGVITQEELEQVLGKDQVDTLDLSSIDKDADQKVTKEEYDLWQQEAVIHQYLETMKNQAAKDLVGQSPEDIAKFIEKLNDYEKSFEEEYLKSNKDINKMSKEFIVSINQKYTEIKKDTLSNTKSAITARVVGEVIDDFINEDKRTGGVFLKKIDEKSSSLSDNAKRLLTNELSREAEKFIKKYEGNALETDLKAYLKNYLQTTDKDKLSDAVGLWEKGKKELENLPEELKFMKLRGKAKNLLITALEQDINLKVGDIYVRSEAAIPAALGQFKDSDSLIWAFDKAVAELSSKTRAQEIREKDEERRAAAVEEAYAEFQEQQKEEVDLKNFFN